MCTGDGCSTNLINQAATAYLLSKADGSTCRLTEGDASLLPKEDGYSPYTGDMIYWCDTPMSLFLCIMSMLWTLFKLFIILSPGLLLTWIFWTYG